MATNPEHTDHKTGDKPEGTGAGADHHPFTPESTAVTKAADHEASPSQPPSAEKVHVDKPAILHPPPEDKPAVSEPPTIHLPPTGTVKVNEPPASQPLATGKATDDKPPTTPTSTVDKHADNKLPATPTSTVDTHADNKLPATPTSTVDKPADNKLPATPTSTFDKPADNKLPATPTSTFDKPADNKPSTTPTSTFDKPADNKPPSSLASTFDKPADNKPPVSLTSPFDKPVAPKPPVSQPSSITNPVVSKPPPFAQPAPIKETVINAALASQSPSSEKAASTVPLLPKPTDTQKSITVNIPPSGTAGVNIGTTDVSKKVERPALSVPPSSIVGKAAKSSLDICGATTTIIIFAIFAIIPISQLYIGLRHKNECPINWRIPHYLIIAGAVGLVGIALSIIQSLLQLYIKKVMSEDPDTKPKGLIGCCVASCGVCGIGSTSIIINLFLLGWGIAGCVWVFGVYNKVQYERPTKANYCYMTLYRFAFWILVISIASYMYGCCCSGARVRQQNALKKNTARAPTTQA